MGAFIGAAAAYLLVALIVAAVLYVFGYLPLRFLINTARGKDKRKRD